MGTGGSRFGAGRPGWRRNSEQMSWLDIRRLARADDLRDGRYSSQLWSRGGEPAGSINVRAAQDHVRLIYTWMPKDYESQKMDYPVWIERTPCRYGGSRPWFRCPRCQRRCAVLYGVANDGRFGCRSCMRLGYSSEAESTLDRLHRKQRKLERQLGGGGQRPKGIRRITYEQISRQLQDLDAAIDNAFCLSAIRLLHLLA